MAMQDGGCSYGLFVLMLAEYFLANLPLRDIHADVLNGVRRWPAVTACDLNVSERLPAMHTMI